MTNRLRLLQLANGLMYFGPLLAGLGGFGWRVVPAFTLIFMLWLVVMRPGDWPQTADDWHKPGAVPGAAARLAVQLLLVVVLFGLGRGIGGVMGVTPVMPTMLPVGLSFLAIPFARLIWNPRRTPRHSGQPSADMSATLAGNADRDIARRMTQPLADLSPEVGTDQIAAHLAALSPYLSPALLFQALAERVQASDAPVHLRRALILQATDGRVAEACHGQAAPVKALQAAQGDDALLALFAERCACLLRENVDAWGDCPHVAALERVAASAGPQAAQALRDLAALNLRLAPLNGDGHGVASRG